MPDIDHEYTDKMICPHCGCACSHAWELSGEDGETDCGRCLKPFSWSRMVSVSYTTQKLEPHDDTQQKELHQ